MSKVTSTIDIMNKIYQNASPSYQKAVPFLTYGSKIEELSNPIMSYSPLKNEFIDGITNMIGMTFFTHLEAFENPLAGLMKGEKPMGLDIREIAQDLITATKYDMSTEGIADMLKLAPPVMQEAIHRVNRQEKYQITISNAELKLAFTSWSEMEQLITRKAEILYASNFRDEFEWTKSLLTETVQKGYIDLVEVPEVVDETTGKKFVKAVKNCVSAFKFPSNKHNQLYHMDDEKRITSWCKPEDTYLIGTAEVFNNVDVDVLSVAFNLDKMNFLAGNKYEVDTLGFIRVEQPTEEGEPVTYKYYALDAIVCDKAFTQIYNDTLELWETELSSVMAWNRFLHVWQVYSTSPFVNVAAIVHEVDEDDIPTGYFGE